MSSQYGAKVDYQESGAGPVVLFVSGSFSTPAAWRPVIERLPQRYRFVATSICGYGATADTRSRHDFDMAHEVRVIEAVARRAGQPVHLVGHSFGGTVALAAALSGTVDVLSIATFEANPLVLMRERGCHGLFEETRRISAAYETAVGDGESDAPRRIIDFWGGTGSYAAMPAPVRAYCCETAHANVLDWHTCFGFAPGLADYGRLTVPALVVRGALAVPAMVEITEGLRIGLRDARTAQVDGASHFLITSHAAECARLLAGFLEEVAR